MKRLKKSLTTPSSVPVPVCPVNKYRDTKINYWKYKLQELGWPKNTKFSFEVNKWGSCQYSTAYELYKLYFMIRQDLNSFDTLSVLGIKFKSGSKRQKEFNIFNEDIFGQFIKNYYENSNIRYMSREKTKKPLWEKDRIEHYRLIARRSKSFDDMFMACRSFAWDLWQAVPIVSTFAFGKYKLTVLKSPGCGPICNQHAQSRNFEVGILSALLKDYNFIKNEKSFSGFDT